MQCSYSPGIAVRPDFQKEQVMSNTQFIEALSADPYVRALSRQAIRLLNDPTLDRQQRQTHIRRLQSLMVEHELKQAAKASRLVQKQQKREQVARGNLGVAAPSQVVARCQEFRQVGRQGNKPATNIKARPVLAASDKQLPLRNRVVLTLKRA